MRKKKHFYTVVCLIAGVILLTTAAAANYGNANGYPMYKSAIKRILYEDNYTASLKLELLYNGETTISSQQTYMLDAKGEVVKYDTNESTRNSEFDHYYESWTVRNTASKEGEPKYLSISRNRDNWSIYPSYGEPWNNPAEDELTSKTIRFVELLADTFIGDIKNNFVQTSNADGLVSYQVVLSGNQLPEYVSAGLSMLFSASKESNNGSYVYYDNEFDYSNDENGELRDKAWRLIADKNHVGVVHIAVDGSLHYFETRSQYFESEFYKPDMTDVEDILNMIETEPVPKSAKCFITLDDEGRLVNNVIEGIVSAYDKNGEEHTLGLRITADFTDYGTTSIEYPEIPEGTTVFDYSKPALDKEVYTYRVESSEEISEPDSVDE